MLKKWLKQPSADREVIVTRLNSVEFFVTNPVLRSDIQSKHLRVLPDIEKLATKFYRVEAQLKHSASLVDCVKVYNMIGTITDLVNCLKGYLSADAAMNQCVSHMILVPLKGCLADFATLKKAIAERIVINSAK